MLTLVYAYNMISKDFSLQVARRIKELRTSQKLTQETLASKADMDTTSFSRIERGQNPDVRLKTLDRIIKALGVDYPTFFTFTDDDSPKNQIAGKLPLLNEDDELLDIINRLLDRVQNK